MDFVRRMMVSAQVQNVVARVDLAGQNLIVAANEDDSQNMQHHTRRYKSALAWSMDRLDRIGQRCGWPHAVRN
jgi:hypothetical protein